MVSRRVRRNQTNYTDCAGKPPRFPRLRRLRSIPDIADKRTVKRRCPRKVSIRVSRCERNTYRFFRYRQKIQREFLSQLQRELELFILCFDSEVRECFKTRKIMRPKHLIVPHVRHSVAQQIRRIGDGWKLLPLPARKRKHPSSVFSFSELFVRYRSKV